MSNDSSQWAQKLAWPAIAVVFGAGGAWTSQQHLAQEMRDIRSALDSHSNTEGHAGLQQRMLLLESRSQQASKEREDIKDEIGGS